MPVLIFMKTFIFSFKTKGFSFFQKLKVIQIENWKKVSIINETEGKKAFQKTDNLWMVPNFDLSALFFFKDRMSERNQTHCTLYYAHLLNSIQAAKKGTWGQTMILKWEHEWVFEVSWIKIRIGK